MRARNELSDPSSVVVPRRVCVGLNFIPQTQPLHRRPRRDPPIIPVLPVIVDLEQPVVPPPVQVHPLQGAPGQRLGKTFPEGGRSTLLGAGEPQACERR